MFSFYKVILHIHALQNFEISKNYYDKCVENLKELNKESNRVSQFIFALILLVLFSKFFTKVKVLDNEINIQLLKILTPTLICYFVLEWLMIAKRRRDLIFAVQQLSYILFNIIPSKEDEFFPGFDPNTLNVMPFSFMCELLTIDKAGRFNTFIKRLTLLLLLISLLFILSFSFANYWQACDMRFDFIWPHTYQIFLDIIGFYACLAISLQSLFWIIYHYRIEFKNINESKKMVEKALKSQEQQNYQTNKAEN